MREDIGESQLSEIAGTDLGAPVPGVILFVVGIPLTAIAVGAGWIYSLLLHDIATAQEPLKPGVFLLMTFMFGFPSFLCTTIVFQLLKSFFFPSRDPDSRSFFPPFVWLIVAVFLGMCVALVFFGLVWDLISGKGFETGMLMPMAVIGFMAVFALGKWTGRNKNESPEAEAGTTD
jgi:hypothetical protein